MTKNDDLLTYDEACKLKEGVRLSIDGIDEIDPEHDFAVVLFGKVVLNYSMRNARHGYNVALKEKFEAAKTNNERVFRVSTSGPSA